MSILFPHHKGGQERSKANKCCHADWCCVVAWMMCYMLCLLLIQTQNVRWKQKPTTSDLWGMKTHETVLIQNHEVLGQNDQSNQWFLFKLFWIFDRESNLYMGLSASDWDHFFILRSRWKSFHPLLFKIQQKNITSPNYLPQQIKKTRNFFIINILFTQTKSKTHVCAIINYKKYGFFE